MKTLPLLVAILILVSCINSKNSIDRRIKIERELIASVYIKKGLNGTDSIRLDEEQIKRFVKEWNNAKSEGLYKMGPRFWLIFELKNDSIRKFATNKNLIKEKNDWVYSISDSTLISSFWKPKYSFDKPEKYSPISFVKETSKKLKTNTDTLKIGITTIEEFPLDWVKEEHIEQLMILLDSKEVCGCYLNPLSSFIQTEDFGEVGGYARVFISAFKEKEKVKLGLYSCPKVNENINMELRRWWKEREQK